MVRSPVAAAVVFVPYGAAVVPAVRFQRMIRLGGYSPYLFLKSARAVWRFCSSAATRALLAAATAAAIAGTSSAVRIAMIRITTSSSTIVKPGRRAGVVRGGRLIGRVSLSFGSGRVRPTLVLLGSSAPARTEGEVGRGSEPLTPTLTLPREGERAPGNPSRRGGGRCGGWPAPARGTAPSPAGLSPPAC